MGREEPGLRTYRTFIVVFLLVAGLIAVGVGGWLLARGQGFYAFLAVCVLGLFVLMIHGYRQEAEAEEETEKGAGEEEGEQGEDAGPERDR